MVVPLFRYFWLALGLAIEGFVGSGSVYAGNANLNVSATVSESSTFDQTNYTSSTAQITNQEIVWTGNINVSSNQGNSVLITTTEPVASADLISLRQQSNYQGEYFSLGGQALWGRGSFPNPTGGYSYPLGLLNYVIGIKLLTAANGIIPNGLYSLKFTITSTPN